MPPQKRRARAVSGETHKERVKELKNTAHQLTITKIEQAIGDIDKYSGTTVNDLKVFMMSHNLRFAAAKSPGEREMFPELHQLMVAQREKLKISDPAASK